MKYKQLEFDFRSPSEIEEINLEIKKYIDEYEDKEYFRINKYADWWCDKVPRCLGWGIYDGYKNTTLWIKSIYQKLRYGVSDQECWNLSNTFDEYILPRLKHFRKMKKISVPSLIVKSYPANKYDIELAEKRWNEVLDEMIWTFEYIIDNEKFNPIPMTNILFEKDNSFKNKKTSDEEQLIWDGYFERTNILNERKNKGLHLFFTHFESLWD